MTFPVPGGATFLRARSNLADVASPATALANLGALSMTAATPQAGYTLVNGTGTIISWTAPNDGQNHRAALFGSMLVTSTETGGLIVATWTSPDGTTGFHTFYNAGLANGSAIQPGGAFLIIVKPGTVVSLAQNSALTVGAATLWAEIWAA